MTRLNIPLFIALAASVLSAVPVGARDALPHQRMIRKRGPATGPGSVGVAAVIGLQVRQLLDDPNESSTSSTASTTSAAASTSRAATSTAPAATLSSSSSTSVTPTLTASSTSTGGLLDTLTGVLLSSSTSTTVSSTSTTSSTTSSSSSTSTTSSSSTSTIASQTTPQEQPTTPAQPSLNLATTTSPSAVVVPTSISVVTSIQPAAAASESAAKAKKTATITRNTIISLVVVASCIGGAIAIWTVIRKWKLSPSERFDDRMQPIDWAPPGAMSAEENIEEKTKHRRAGSGASHGSFTSGGVAPSEQGHGAKAGMYNDSQQGHGYGMPSQDFPPAHDFTAGTAQPGGYGQYYGAQQYAGGAPGYVDLQRGPSVSESTFSHGASVTRGLSYNRGHGGYEAQPGAGVVPPLPNPYGGEYGYEDYGHQQAGHQPVGQQQAPGQGQYRAY